MSRASSLSYSGFYIPQNWQDGTSSFLLLIEPFNDLDDNEIFDLISADDYPIDFLTEDGALELNAGFDICPTIL